MRHGAAFSEAAMTHTLLVLVLLACIDGSVGFYDPAFSEKKPTIGDSVEIIGSVSLAQWIDQVLSYSMRHAGNCLLSTFDQLIRPVKLYTSKFGYWNRMFHQKTRNSAMTVCVYLNISGRLWYHGILGMNFTVFVCSLPSNVQTFQDIHLHHLETCMKESGLDVSLRDVMFWYQSLFCEDIPPESKRVFPENFPETVPNTPYRALHAHATVLNSPFNMSDTAIASGLDDEASVLCMFDHSGILQPPRIHYCIHYIQRGEAVSMKQALEHCSWTDSPFTRLQQVAETELCQKSSEGQLLKARYIVWVLAKLNYLLIAVVSLLLISFVLRWNCKWRNRQSHHPQKFFHPVLATTSIVWLTWRLQETMHSENNWRESYPYLCLFTNSVCYVSEALCLYMFAASSLERYQAVARPLKWRAVNIRSLHNSVIIVAGVIGSGGSLLNIILLTAQGDVKIMQTCSFPSVTLLRPLHFLIAIKILNLAFVYCCPCVVLVAANVAILLASRKRKHHVRSTRRIHKKKMSYILRFLVFSSLFMLCCLPEPIFDLKLAIDGVSKVQPTTASVGSFNVWEIIADAVIWNLSTVAFALNTIVGMQYTST